MPQESLQIQERVDWNSIHQEINKSVVMIEIFGDVETIRKEDGEKVLVNDRLGSGTGWFFDTDGRIMTNQHIVNPQTRAVNISHVVTLSTGERVSNAYEIDIPNSKAGTNIGITDVAVLKIDGHTTTPVKLGKSKDIKATDEIITLGYPIPLSIDPTETTITIGVVSNANANSEFLGDKGIFLNATIVGGNSGGVVVNTDGEVIGITTGSTGDSNGMHSFAISIDHITTVIEHLDFFTTANDIFEDLIKAKTTENISEQRKLLISFATLVSEEVSQYQEGEERVSATRRLLSNSMIERNINVILPTENVFYVVEHLDFFTSVNEVFEKFKEERSAEKKSDLRVSFTKAIISLSKLVQEEVSQYKEGEDKELAIKRTLFNPIIIGSIREIASDARNREIYTNIFKEYFNLETERIEVILWG